MTPLIREFPPGTRFADLDPDELRGQVFTHRVVVLRGLHPEGPVDWPASVKRLGPLQAWPFGAVHEIKVDREAKNYLYTTHDVPLHWDGAFKGEIPGILAFQCHRAPPPESGGETVFVDTVRLFEEADDATRASLRAARYRYTTERKAHYGGTFETDVVSIHPITGETVLRYAEPVDDLNPVHVQALTACDALPALLAAPNARYEHAWKDGDVVLADNHALLHGRRAFTAGAPRHLLRVNILDDDGNGWTLLRDLVRIRRIEFAMAELPIVLIPLGLIWAPGLEPLRAAIAVGVLWLLYQAGDMANCLADREVDVAGKTALSEAIRRLGTRNVGLQIALTGVAALIGAAWLGLDILALTVLGVFLAVEYSLGPIKAKSRGLLQLPYSAGILFLGPMVLVEQAVLGRVSGTIVAVAIAFGTMQQGALLVNIVEDLREDVRHGYRTAGVVLGQLGSVRGAFILNALGGLAYMALMDAAWWSLLPFAAAWLWVLARIGDLALQVQRYPDEARDRIRKRVPELPGWLSFQAWMALIPAWVG